MRDSVAALVSAAVRRSSTEFFIISYQTKALKNVSNLCLQRDRADGGLKHLGAAGKKDSIRVHGTQRE